MEAQFVYHVEEAVRVIETTLRILQECSCLIEFIKRVGEKRKNARLATSLINSIKQEHEC